MNITRLTAAEFTSVNPVLHKDEIGREEDTGLIKIGDGSTAWVSLPYSAALPDLSNVPGYPNWRVKGANVIRAINGFPFPASISNTSLVAANYQTFSPIDLPDSITIDQWGIYLATQGVGGTQQATLALYARDANMAPTGNPILGLDTAAPVINLITSSTGLVMVNLSSHITIPPGGYYLSVIASSTGQTSFANIGFVTSTDPRLGGGAGANESIGGLAWGALSPTPSTAPPLASLSGGISWLAYVRQTG